jgi:cytochrome c oxidase subunit 4
MEHQITSRRTYFFVYLALLVLLLATVGAHYLNLGVFNFIITLAIAAIKALLVILFFMHVRLSDTTTKLFVGAGFIWLAILIGLTLTDYFTR